MATSLLFMATDQPGNHDEQQAMKPLSGSSEETRNEPGRIRGRKGNVKGPKKQPQRGLGVAQLEKLRIQECWKKMSESSSSSGVPTTTFPDHHHHHQHHNFLQCHPQMLPFAVHDPFGNTSGGGSSSSIGGVPVRYGASSAPNHVHGGGFHCPQQVIHGNTVGVITGHGSFMGNKITELSVGSGGGVGGWVVPNTQPHRVGSCGSRAPLWSPLVGTPLETSRELSSMPNLHSELECFDDCLKRTRFNEDSAKGSNARKDKPLDIWPNGPDFLGYSPQPAAPNLDGEASDFYNKPARHDAAADATHSLDEGVEVVAVHRKGNSMSGRVFMEYEFFPGKDGRGTASKELELPTIGSVVAVAGEASSITAATAYRNTADCNNIDLSLKLSR